jgi:lactoylglutathione lyase
MLTLAYTILYVRDVTASIEFYETAFGLTRKFITPDGSYGELATGATTLSFAALDLAGSNLPGGFTESKPGQIPFGFEIGFTTSDVSAALDKAVSAGATVAASPTTKPWGQVVAYVQDINGFLVEICTPMV